MSLYSSIQLANNSLRANQIGLQVVGQNIANANTPGYLREEVQLSPAPTQRQGGVLTGLGVNVDAVVQKVDKFLQSRLRDATSDRAGSETQQQTYANLEQILGELSDSDLSTSLNNFFSGVNEILNQPESVATRNLATLQGKTLAGDIQRLDQRVRDVRTNLNDQVKATADDINRLTEQIRDLNVRIATAEGGDVSKSDAVGLRDQREQALNSLAELIDIRVDEQPSGAVNVAVNGSYLVSDGIRREVKTDVQPDRGLGAVTLRWPIRMKSSNRAPANWRD